MKNFFSLTFPALLLNTEQFFTSKCRARIFFTDVKTMLPLQDSFYPPKWSFPKGDGIN